MKTTIEAPDTREVETESSALVTQANALTIATKEDHGGALAFLKRTATAKAQVVALFREPKAAAHAAHKAITAAESKLLTPLDDARRIVEAKALAYEDAARRAAEEEQRRLAALAQKAEEERLIAEAIAADAAGDAELAEAIVSEPVSAPVVHVAPAVAKVAGVSSRGVWKAEVTDKLALVRFVAANPSWLHLLEAEMSALNGLAKSQKGQLQIPGVRCVEVRGLALRAGA